MAGALVTTVVGSYPQPDWLIDRERLGDRLPPRVRARELWRVPEPLLEAQDDATRLAVQDMERAGVDVITDGEMRRESYSNRFATALDGVDLDQPGVALDRTGHENPVPRVVGPIHRREPVEVEDVEFLGSITDRRTKITVPGPFTMTHQAQDDHYDDERSLALAYADAVNEELRDLKAAGADVVQTSRTCRPVPSRPGSTPSRRSTGHWTASRATRCSTLATRTSSTTGSPATVPPRAERVRRHARLARGGAAGSPARGAARAPGQGDRPRRARPRLGRGRDAGRRRGPDPPCAGGPPPERLVVAPDCGMKYLHPRSCLPQAAGDGRGCKAGG